MSYEFKIILLGESGVGKTSLIHSYTTGHFNPNRNVTKVVNLMSKDFTLEGKKIKLCIWDTSSQEFFKNVYSNYYDGFLLVYDITNMITFDVLSQWLKLVRRKNDEAAVLIVGNKIDLPDCNAISNNVIRNFVDGERIEWIESSAKNGYNVTEIFERLTLKILEAKHLISNEEVSCESSRLSNVNCVENSSNEISHKSFDDEVSSTSINQSAVHEVEQLPVLNLKSPPLEPEIHIYNNKDHESTPGSSQTTTNCIENGHSSFPQADLVNGDDDDDMEEIEESFIFVSYLPPVVPLPDDIPLLRVKRRRTSADSVLDLMTEDEINDVKLRARSPYPGMP